MLRRARLIRDYFIPGVFGLLVLITLVCVLAGCGGTSGANDDPGGTGAVATGRADRSPAAARDGLGTIRAGALPSQARRTLDLIDHHGPYPYRQDDAVFGNREHLLPQQPRGYYREYTVRTPGSADRGARRIVAARDGTCYYSDDHYDSFRRIER